MKYLVSEKSLKLAWFSLKFACQRDCCREIAPRLQYQVLIRSNYCLISENLPLFLVAFVGHVVCTLLFARTRLICCSRFYCYREKTLGSSFSLLIACNLKLWILFSITTKLTNLFLSSFRYHAVLPPLFAKGVVTSRSVQEITSKYFAFLIRLLLSIKIELLYSACYIQPRWRRENYVEDADAKGTKSMIAKAKDVASYA